MNHHSSLGRSTAAKPTPRAQDAALAHRSHLWIGVCFGAAWAWAKFIVKIHQKWLLEQTPKDHHLRPTVWGKGGHDSDPQPH